MFVLAGVLTALAAIVNAVRFTQVPPNTGLGFEMKVIAAVVVGGAAITGGRGTIAGTVLGAVLLGMSGPALDLPWRERVLGTRAAGRHHPRRGRDSGRPRVPHGPVAGVRQPRA